MNARAELSLLAAGVRRIAEWDAEDGLIGYPPARANGWPELVTACRLKAPEAFAAAAALGHASGEDAPTPEGQLDVAHAPAQDLSTAPDLAPPSETPSALAATRPTLPAVRSELGDCQRCKLATSGRTTIVFGEGDPGAELMFVGEGPGFFEDQTGRPFVGKAGELLEKMINAMSLTRAEVYICNVVKCRPPENRNPEPDEIIACRPFLHAQIRAIRPKVVVALGKFAAQVLLDSSEPVSRLRGRWFEYVPSQLAELDSAAVAPVRLMPTFHPAYLLRNPDDKKLCWADLKLVMGELGLPRSAL